MNRGVNRQTIFFTDQDRADFVRRLSIVRARLGVSVYAYSLMGNHYHLLVHSPPGMLSEAMHLLTSGFARATNDHQGRDGPLFRGRFHSLAVETEAYLLAASRYIHLNPRDLGIEPRQDRWSSYGAYLGLRACPDFLDLSPVLELFNGSRQDLAAFTEGPENVFDTRLVTPTDIRLLIEAAVGVQDMFGAVAEEANRHLERSLALLLLDHPLTIQAYAAVRELVGDLSADAERMARRRARQRLGNLPEIRAALKQVVRALPIQDAAA